MTARYAQNGVAMQQPELEGHHILTHAANRFQERAVGGLVSLHEFIRRYAQRGRRQFDAVELLGVMQDCRQSLGANIGTDALDDARRRQGFAKYFLRQRSTSRGNDVALGVELLAQFG
jgi:hypothetical protein